MQKQDIVFEGERIIGEQIYIRPITKDDTDNIIKWRNSDAVRPYFIYQKDFTRESHEHWLDTMIFSGKGFQFIICDKETDEPLGSSFLRDYDTEHNKSEYGIFLGENKTKGRGIGVEANILTLAFAFEKKKMHKVFSRIFVDNEPSIRMVKRAGMTEEGILRGTVRVKGVYRDMALLSILEDDWKL